MSYPKILTIQDISCVGQCSLTVALPILSAAGLETCILPSAVLSTHTAGFTGFTVRDLTEDIPGIAAHWRKEHISFDAIYTGYLGSREQIAYVKDIFATLLADGGLTIVDPAMADNGKLYPAFDLDYVEAMKSLAFTADFILPNITEACFLTGTQFRTEYDERYIDALLDALTAQGARSIVLTGVGYREGRTGVVVQHGGELDQQVFLQRIHTPPPSPARCCRASPPTTRRASPPTTRCCASSAPRTIPTTGTA